MTDQTTAPKADGNPQKLRLHELLQLVPIHCQRRDEAIAVQDGISDPQLNGRVSMRSVK